MKTLKNVKELYEYVNQVLNFWNSGDETKGGKVEIPNHCWDNSVGFYFNYKHNFTNKIWIKHGGVYSNNSDLPLAHCWNVVKIGNKKYIIDLTLIYMRKLGFNIEYKYCENIDGYTFKHDYKTADLIKMKDKEMEPEKLPPPELCDISKQKENVDRLKEIYAKNIKYI